MCGGGVGGVVVWLQAKKGSDYGMTLTWFWIKQAIGYRLCVLRDLNRFLGIFVKYGKHDDPNVMVNRHNMLEIPLNDNGEVTSVYVKNQKVLGSNGTSNHPRDSSNTDITSNQRTHRMNWGS